MNTRPTGPAWNDFVTPKAAIDHLRAHGWRQLNGKHGSWFHFDRPAVMREIQQNFATGLWDVVETTIE